MPIIPKDILCEWIRSFNQRFEALFWDQSPSKKYWNGFCSPQTRSVMITTIFFGQLERRFLSDIFRNKNRHFGKFKVDIFVETPDISNYNNFSSTQGLKPQKYFKRTELRSVHWRYLSFSILLFALLSQSFWLIFASFGNFCRFFTFSQVWKKKHCRENMHHKTSW